MPLIGNVLKSLAQSVLIPLGLTASSSETDAAIDKKIFGSSLISLIISIEKINNIMQIVQSPEECTNLLRNLLANKGTIRTGERQ